MQRVRIGLTGLGLVFLLVLIGAVIRSASDDPPPVNAVGQPVAAEAEANGQAKTGDPLSQLGVAPGDADAANAAAGGSPKH